MANNQPAPSKAEVNQILDREATAHITAPALRGFEKEVFKAFMEVAPVVIRHFIQDKSICILATAITIDVFKYFGIKGEAHPCRVRLYNEIAARRLIAARSAGTLPTDDAAFHKLLTSGGGWSIGLGFGQANPGVPMPGFYAGHLVTVFKAFAPLVVIDLTLSQADRPNKNMILEPLCVPASEAFLTGEEQLAGWAGPNQNVFVLYESIENDAYLNSSDYTDPRKRKQIVDTICREIDLIIFGENAYGTAKR